MNPKEFKVNGSTGWRTLAEPTYGVSRFGRTVEFPAGTTIRRLVGSVIGSEPFPDAIRVVATKGSAFECEPTVLVLPDGTSKPPFEVPALWWVTASALRFEGDREWVTPDEQAGIRSGWLS